LLEDVGFLCFYLKIRLLKSLFLVSKESFFLIKYYDIQVQDFNELYHF
jgi:hypothetical protein